MKYLKVGTGATGGDSESDYDKAAGLILEQLKVLRTKIDLISRRRKCRKIAVTSAIAGEGKTFLSTNLALQMARRDNRKVLMLDADIRKSSVAKYLGVTPIPGLSEFLSDGAKITDIVQVLKREGLYVISGGATDTVSSDLIMSHKFEKFLDCMEEKFDYVIIDTPPVIPVADLAHIKTLVDGILFVFRLGYTPYGLFEKALEEVGQDNVIGVVLNCSEEIGSAEGKYYTYKYGSGYGAKPDAQKNVIVTGNG